MSLKRVDLIWDATAEPFTHLEINGNPVDLEHGARVAVVIDAALDTPMVDISLGTPLPLVLGDPRSSEEDSLSTAEWLDRINPDRLKQAVLQAPQGLEGLDPVSLSLKILRDWARA